MIYHPQFFSTCKIIISASLTLIKGYQFRLLRLLPTYNAINVVETGTLLQLHMRLVDTGCYGSHPIVVLAALITLQGHNSRRKTCKDARRQSPIHAHRETFSFECALLESGGGCWPTARTRSTNFNLSGVWELACVDSGRISTLFPFHFGQ